MGEYEIGIECSYEENIERFYRTPEEFSYEDKVALLDQILGRIDNAETSIDDLARDVKLGATLIKELRAKLMSVETEVKDVFKELDNDRES